MATKLHIAVQAESLEEVSRLTKRKKPNLVDAPNPETKETPLHLAAKLGHKDIVEVLLAAGADPQMRCSIPQCNRFETELAANALAVAAAFGHASVIEVLLAATGSEAPDKSYGYFRPVDLAAIYGHTAALDLLLARHTDLVPSIKSRALCFALSHGHAEAVRTLISRGADVNGYSYQHVPDEYPVYPWLAAFRPYTDLSGEIVWKSEKVVLELLQILAKARADVNLNVEVPNSCGRSEAWVRISILSAVVFSQDQDLHLARFFLANGADINTKDQRGWTAFHYAVARGDPDIVDLFLQSGCSHQVDWKVASIFRTEEFDRVRKWTALDIVGMSDDRLLYGNDENVTNDYIKIIKMLVKNGARLDAKNEIGYTPLHSACLITTDLAPAGCTKSNAETEDVVVNMTLHRILPMISALLQAGANPNSINKVGQTPLHILLTDIMSAIEKISDEYYYNSLLSNGCSLIWSKEKEKPGIKALFASICSCICLLVEAGADLSLRGLNGRDPLQEMMQEMVDYYQRKNDNFLSDDAIKAKYASLGLQIEEIPLYPQHELDPIVVELIKWGASSWDAVPEPCLGLEKALSDVWKRVGGTELRYLFYKLKREVKPRLRTSLLALNRRMPGATEVHMQILGKAI
jgi:ankyrin repeat protein